MHLLGHEVRSRVLRVIVDHFSLAKCRCKRNVIFYTCKRSSTCISHPLCGIDLKPACIIAAGASMSFRRAAFRAPGISTLRLNEEGTFVKSIPFLLKDAKLAISVVDNCDTCSAGHHVGMELQSRALCMTLI